LGFGRRAGAIVAITSAVAAAAVLAVIAFAV
jgi:hypothetical protein